MAKWEDYVLTKISFNQEGRQIEAAFVYDDYENHIDNGELRTRDWLVAETQKGKTFCGATRSADGWYRLGPFNYEGAFKWDFKLPQALTRRKTFLSYYHHDDQAFRESFQKITTDLITSISVENNDIDSDNSDEYIKQLIQKDYICDITVLIVLVGPKTKCRKHVDWEISGALDHKVGDRYAGLIGILLPTHPDYGKGTYNSDNLPERLAANANSGYAQIYDWTTDRIKIQNWIEAAYGRRSEDKKIINRSIPQMQNNSCV
ncbi:TIR domain-containing protein [Ferruginibacter paludis]|uniref:TIR domain-containing protein n=1 Tax=Ferruginibacter paludis TaxID=1310417 RepID=UPI0025B528C0|nr:TIR domain-containing protein [Ferruginibacter paludis]MDN3657831.1 TIR domain-containing protein [Ferruginibacter paludis]